jgi:NitT/TauT family transport system permease protein
MTGIRQGIGRGLVGLVAGEFFLSGTGIGLLIMQSERDFDVPGLYASILVITILGVLLMGLGRALENRFAAWRGLNR